MSCDFVALALPAVRALQMYQPGKPIEELARELGFPATDIIKLASNENPLGPPRSAIKAMQLAFSDLSRYPDANGYLVKRALSEKHKVDCAQITLGNGSNDVLVLLAEVYLGAGSSAVYSEYAFFVYSLITKATGAEGVEVPSVDWGHDLEGMSASIRADTRMVFLANPNNPTGTSFHSESLIAFLRRVPDQVLVILDEAYFEYKDGLDDFDAISLINNYPNLVVTRTFSKAFGLAGCRLGYCISSQEVADVVNRLRQPFNVNSLAQVAALAALEDSDYLEKSRVFNTNGMVQLQSGLSKLGLNFISSSGNFVCVDLSQDAYAIYEKMLSFGVIVRPIANYNMPKHLRISIGLPDENQRCLDVMEMVI